MCLQVPLSALLVTVFGVYFAVSGLQINATSELYRSRRQTTCKPNEYRCQNGQCISSYDKCDGTAHCSDGSDETSKACKSAGIKCPLRSFECAYGACIDDRLRCNGKVDCADGSDESCHGSTSPTSCSVSEFQCTDGQCISVYDICDGKQHCADKSDESSNVCQDYPCPPRSFKCSYGACVGSSLKCDGKADCIDGSDEPRECPTTPTTTTTMNVPWRQPSPQPPLSGTPVGGSCKLPLQPTNGAYFSTANECSYNRQAAFCNTPGTIVPPNWVIKYTCNNGYSTNRDSHHSICENGVWQQTIDCIKLCPPLISTSVDVKCVYGGMETYCNVSMKPDTQVTAMCKPHYKQYTLAEYSTLWCLNNGEWSYPLFYCVADCGVNHKPVALISNGSETNISEVPWLAAIYRKSGQKWDQQCGGTLVSTRLVVTAAHCLIKSVSETVALHPTEVKVGLGKYYRDYYKKEPTSIIADVNNVVIPSDYAGQGAAHALDIGLLDLVVSVQVSAFIMPACIDWSGSFRPSPDAVGLVAGWGKTQSHEVGGQSSDVALLARLKYINYIECVRQLPVILKTYLSHDKFCAGDSDGSEVQKGDSGGGLTFLNGDRYFLIGVVSTKLQNYSFFTNIGSEVHKSWLEKEKLRLKHSR